jgi:tetratricopeptide (TPR) repeat protein
VSSEEHPDPKIASGSDEGGATATWSMDSTEAAGAVIGRYRLVQKIGEGGMGEVWLAEQKEPVRRRVALKLVKAGMNTREVIARFESERQALALMDHPAIAKVFDAGSTVQGAPYFVMEYVAGVPITTYCDNHKLTTRDRLELFIRVCEGVQHAHQKAIIHRDLKPSNILVTEVDGHPAPKIIDFGVAKALTQKLTAETMFTRLGAIIGTPEYMSPEQALSSGEDIDTRTDVYSLGIVLYELLAGAPPIELRKIAFDEFLRRLREEDPQKPSTKIRTQDAAGSTDLARKRQTEPPALARQMRGDLDSIALKALEKDRARRYGSPSDFAADIGRYLNNEPVLAVAPSAIYRARKFARRYRVALGTACAFALVLIVASVVSIRQSIRANREAAVAQAVNDFLQNDVLAQASAATQAGPNASPDPDLKVRTALDRAAARIAGRFDKQPEVEASIRVTIGQTYNDLGLYAEAKKHYERALELYRETLGDKNPKTLQTMYRIGVVDHNLGRYDEAENFLKQALDVQGRVLGPIHPDTRATAGALSTVYLELGKYAQAEAVAKFNPQADPYGLGIIYEHLGKYAEAEVLIGRGLERQRRMFGPEHPRTLSMMHNLAIVYDDQGKYAQAEALESQALEIKRRVLGPEHRDTLVSMNELGFEYLMEGKYAQAEAIQSEVVEISRRTLGAEHSRTLEFMDTLAQTYWAEGKYAKSEAIFDQILAVARRHPEAPDTLAYLWDFASMYQREGNYALAETYFAQSLAGRRRTLGPDHPDTMLSAADLALARVSQGKFAESEPLAREALGFYQKKQPDDWLRFRAESLLGASLAGQKKYAEAEPLLLEGYQGMLARKSRIDIPDWYHLDLAHEWLVQLYKDWGKPDKAAEWRRK